MPTMLISVGFGTVIAMPSGIVIDHVVAVAERELQVLALQRGAVTDAGDLELLLETLGDALDQVRDLRARGAVQRAGAVGLVARRDLDRAVLELHVDVVVDDELKLALRPLHLDGLTLDARGDARGDRDGLFADT